MILIEYGLQHIMGVISLLVWWIQIFCMYTFKFAEYFSGLSSISENKRNFSPHENNPLYGKYQNKEQELLLGAVKNTV